MIALLSGKTDLGTGRPFRSWLKRKVQHELTGHISYRYSESLKFSTESRSTATWSHNFISWPSVSWMIGYHEGLEGEKEKNPRRYVPHWDVVRNFSPVLVYQSTISESDLTKHVKAKKSEFFHLLKFFPRWLSCQTLTTSANEHESVLVDWRRYSNRRMTDDWLIKKHTSVYLSLHVFTVIAHKLTRLTVIASVPDNLS